MAYADFFHRLFQSHIQAIGVAFLPLILMGFNAWLKIWLDLPWRTYGADTAFCGVATLCSAVIRSAWLSPEALRAAFIILLIHFIFWTGVLWLAGNRKGVWQALTGGAVFYSAVNFALFYFQPLKL